jgi:hypothetical protein
MRNSRIIFIIFGLASQTLSAQTTLYACTIKGHTTLESFPGNDCETLVVYHYPTYNKVPQTLRSEEVRQLQYDSQESQIMLDANEVGSMGWVAVHDYFDSRADKCAASRRQLDNALFYIEAKNRMKIEIGPYRSAELAAQILQGQSQISRYC